MDRRQFLKMIGVTPLLLSRAGPLWASATAGSERTLVLVELAGGNDGLNTVIPYADLAYRRLRPSLAVPESDVMPLSDRLGLNDHLEPLMGTWDAGELAVLLGLGYPEPNRSHFRSIAIWETGSDAADGRDTGWVARALAGRVPEGAVTGGIVLGDAEAGPLAGSVLESLVIDRPADFFETARRLRPLSIDTDNDALGHVLEVQRAVHRSAAELERCLERVPVLGARFPRSDLGRQLALAGRLIAADACIPAIKVTHTGFDTHARQQRVHGTLLTQLAESLSAFRQAMLRAGRWNDVVVMTYSEFGRRAAENASGGTDHGTAAPHFLAGGAVLGGVHGAQPELSDLDDGDLRYATDFRRLYGAVAEQWWGVESPFRDVEPLDGCL